MQSKVLSLYFVCRFLTLSGDCYVNSSSTATAFLNSVCFDFVVLPMNWDDGIGVCEHVQLLPKPETIHETVSLTRCIPDTTVENRVIQYILLYSLVNSTAVHSNEVFFYRVLG